MRKIITVLFFLSFFAPLLHAQDVYTDNVVIVLDASGSMSKSMRDAQGNNVRRIDAAKTAIYEVLKQIPESTHVGVLALIAEDDRAYNKSQVWVYLLGKKDDAKLRKTLEPIQPSANTPLGTFMKMGADRLLQEREKQHNYGSYRLLVVTDGEANNEPSNLVDRCTAEIKARGITIDVIGVAMDKRHTLATKVHSYRAANDPASLTRAIKEVFAEVSSKKDQGGVGEEAFDELASIPNEVAMAMITALSDTGNQPIGEKPKPKPKPVPVPVKTETVQQPTQPTTQPSTRSKGIRLPCVVIPIVAVIVVAVVVVISRRR